MGEAPTKQVTHEGAGGATALNEKESSGTSPASAAGGEDALEGDEQPNDADSDAEDSAPIAKRPRVLLLVRSRREPTSEEEDEELSRRWTCQTIRSKIQTFLAKKTMTQTEFLKTIGANSNSFQRFMKLKGPFGGNQNSTYWGSLKFFDRLEKKAKEEKAAAKASGAKSKTAAKRKAGDDDNDESPAAKKKKFQTRLEQIEAVELPADLKVYDDCDVVRAKIQDFFLTKVMAQTAFAAHLNVSIAALRKYLVRKGKREGVGIVYEAAYRFFEKMRILDNAPKTNKRKKVELERPEGYSLVRDPTHCWVHVSEINPKVRW